MYFQRYLPRRGPTFKLSVNPNYAIQWIWRLNPSPLWEYYTVAWRQYCNQTHRPFHSQVQRISENCILNYAGRLVWAEFTQIRLDLTLLTKFAPVLRFLIMEECKLELNGVKKFIDRKLDIVAIGVLLVLFSRKF